jgi:beta-N-acetylhexosaminidase
LRLGPAMIDVEGLELTAADRERLSHPQTGAVILFARNFESPRQLVALTRSIRELRRPSLPIAVDHEGGRVQRFKRGFSAIPPMRELGRRFDADNAAGLEAARAWGYVIGAELQAHGVDFSFTPVLDLDYGESGVIGDRAFHKDAATVTLLARALQEGLASAGMNTVGKHFPGHGFVRADSHHEIPVDERSYQEIERADLQPFATLARTTMGGVMPAHVIYPAVDSRPAGFSRVWLQDILRKRLRFDGLIFSDDLSMEGASTAGGIVDRADAALDAGCDMVLLCNDAKGAETLLEGLERRPVASSLALRIERMRGKAITHASLEASAAYLAAAENLARARPS